MMTTNHDDACGQCGERRPVMVPMMPGKDGAPWQLCSRCWIEGRQPFKLGRFKVVEISDPHLYDALASASKRTPGLIDHTGAEDLYSPKDDTGDFSRSTPAKKRRRA